MPRSRSILVAALIAAVALLAARFVPAKSGASAAGPGADTSFVRIGRGEGSAGAFVARPGGSQPVPAIVVVHEWWGLNGQIRNLATRLARQGYIAIVPDLYHGKVADDPMRAHELVRGLEQDEALATLGAAVAWIRAQPRTAKSKIAAIGFCMGGGLAQAMGLRGDDIAAVIMFYGTPESDPERLAKLRVPLQAHFGEQDDGIPRKRVDEFRSALEKLGKTHDVYVYPGAGHAFMHDGAPSYRPDAARQAWARTLAFLQKHLKG